MKPRLVHLVAILALSTVLTAVGGAVATYLVAVEEFRDLAEDDVEAEARLLAALIDAARQPDAVTALGAHLARGVPFDDDEGSWVTVHDARSGTTASNLPGSAGLTTAGTRELVLHADGHAWRGFQHRAGDTTVRILRRDARLAEVREEVLEEILAPLLFGSALNVVLIGGISALFLWPLARLVRAIDRRDGNLLAPLDLPAPAGEIARLRDTLNRLFAEIDDVLRRERRFTDDIAHELRTPLTTLKLELAGEVPDRSVLAAQVDRVARLVERLLILARLAHGERSQAFVALDFTNLVRQHVALARTAAAAAGIELETVLDPSAVRGDATLLGMLVDNLLANVQAHCPAGTRAVVKVLEQPRQVELRVSDDGPGLSSAVRAGIARGQSRLDSRGGLGLGLSICQRIAEMHGGHLDARAGSDGRGTTIVVVLPGVATT